MKHDSKDRNGQAAFTLLEILLVVVIIGMLVTVAVVNLSGASKKARLVTARRQISSYETAIGIYELDSGNYPSTEQGLKALITKPGTPPIPGNWKGPYLQPAVIKQDPWYTDYIYKYPGERVPHGYYLYSPGPNKVAGDDDDIGNWQ